MPVNDVGDQGSYPEIIEVCNEYKRKGGVSKGSATCGRAAVMPRMRKGSEVASDP